LIVVVGMILYQQFEDRYLVPRVYGRMLNLPPIIVLIAVLAGAELMGIIGVLLALPLTAAARVAVDFMIENRRLPIIAVDDDTPSAPDGELLVRDEPEQGTPPPTTAQDLQDQVLAPDGSAVPEDNASGNGMSQKAAGKPEKAS
jgi:hypothetical protein